MRDRVKRIWIGTAVAMAAAGLALAAGGVYTQTKHGDATSGVLRLAESEEPRGDCGHCHDQHASRNATPTGGPFPYALFAPDDNQLCYTAGGQEGCHAGPGALDIYPGTTVYDTSSHRTSGSMVWPGPDPRARQSGDAGYCVNCHTPHGRADGSGLIPSMTTVREEGLCEACHDASGPALTDVASDFAKSSRHPAPDFTARHDAAESLPTDFGTANRHAECADCHNPHDVGPDTIAPTPPDASARTQRVSRVSVTNGSAGTVPTYTFRAAGDPAAVLEYEICFKCHSSWTTQPVGQPDLAVLLNTNNPAYHPVEAQGKNTNIRAGAFVNGWAPTDTMYCTDCHAGDGGAAEGPHGSIYDPILKAPYTASPAFRTMSPDELCFQCHNYDTYANDGSSDTVKGYSRWNRPEFGKGHAWHVPRKQVTCYSCHATHGSTSNRFLLVFGRNPGLNNWVEEVPNDTYRCYPTCHGDKTYGINYPH